MYENIKYEVNDGLAKVIICRPKAMNALNEDVLKELMAVFCEINSDDEVKAVIVTGEGKAFVAGADIAQMYELTSLEGRHMMSLGHNVMNYIENMEKPVIAAVNGFALGGGCELAMACDIRIASNKAKFGQPEVGLGIIPGFGGTQRLARLVGKGMAKYLILTADIIDSQEAYRIGLVEKLVDADNLMEVTEKIAKNIMSKAPIAVGTAITSINKGFDLGMAEASAFEVETFTAAFGSDDKKEGMSAFLEKRKAEFKNR
ncbi:MAG TPA: enoyl-CoA hydratase-related protein [Anaerovoracaceae bacterium]|nr:enoyl-CoA hydratase-related protein [Anaerovoracaceae bacterium]